MGFVRGVCKGGNKVDEGVERMTDSRPVEKGHFGMILTKEEAALIMALRHTPNTKISDLLVFAQKGVNEGGNYNDLQRMSRVIDIYEIKIKEGLGVTV